MSQKKEDVTKIRAALEILRVPRNKRVQHSWTKEKYHTQNNDAHCILGALERVGVNIYGANEKDVEAIIEVATEHFPPQRGSWHTVPAFNDYHKRKFDEIEVVMEKAAVLRAESGAREDWTMS